jgi:tryptophan synthase alpha chain
MNSINQLFVRLRTQNRKAFIPFLSAGDPDLAFTREALPQIVAAGADLIEVGFPFSDPIADGPVIQASYTRALRQRLKLADLFDSLKQITSAPGWSAPAVAMASYSLIFKYGADVFLRTASAAGLSGAVVPDLPVEEAEEFAQRCRDCDFKLVLLVTPTTEPARMEKIVRACDGFVYVVSVVGITGERAAVSGMVRQVTTRLRTMTDLPLCVGFGVGKPDHVRELRELCDGVIVGSALVRQLELATTPAGRQAAMANIVTTIRELSGALN